MKVRWSCNAKIWARFYIHHNNFVLYYIAQSHKNSTDKGKTTTPNQDGVVRAIIKFIAKDNVPVNILNGEGFTEMIKDLAPMYTMVAPKLFKAKLDYIYDTNLMRKKNEIQKINHLSLTASIWSNLTTNVSFMDVKAHYMDSGGKIKSVLLSCRIFQEGQSGPDLKSTFEEILTEWNIPVEKITCIVSDGTPSLVDGGKLLVPRRNFICFAHRLALTVISSLTKDNVQEHIQPLEKVRQAVEILNSIPCDQMKREFERLDTRPIKLTQFVETRFPTLYKMINSFLTNFDRITMMLTQFGCSIELSVQEKEFLEDCLLILTPFQLVAEELSNDGQPPLSKVIPISLCLKRAIDAVQPKTQGGILLRQACKETIALNIGDPETADTASVATALDPRFKFVDFQLTRSKNFVTNTINEYLNNFGGTNTDKSDNSNTDLLWSHHDALASNHTVDPAASTTSHPSLKNYLEAPLSHRFADPVAVWHDIGYDKNLKSFALRHLSIPATCVPPKMLFTKEGSIMFQRRNQMSPNQAQKLLFLSSLSLEEFKNN